MHKFLLKLHVGPLGPATGSDEAGPKESAEFMARLARLTALSAPFMRVLYGRINVQLCVVMFS